MVPVLSMSVMGLQKGGGWMGGVRSIQFCSGFVFNVSTLQTPHVSTSSICVFPLSDNRGTGLLSLRLHARTDLAAGLLQLPHVLRVRAAG